MNSNQSKSTIRGVLAAIVTPVTPGGEPDTGLFVHHAKWALANGCDGLNVLGTTGEANSLSAAQRIRVMEVASSELDKTKLMVGTGTPDLQTAIELTNAAEGLGFAGALILPPYYYKGVSDDGLFTWFSKVVETARSIPIYLYNFPQMTGVPISVDLVRRLAAAFPDRLAGAKDSSGDLNYAAELASIDGLAIFPSDEASLARSDQDGFAGCISATVNVTAPLASRLWSDQRDVDRLQRVRAARQTIAAQPLVSAVKYLVGRLHGNPDYARILPPHLPLNDVQSAALAGFEIELP